MKRRINNIFKKDGRAFILAMDHGNGLNVLPELNDTGSIIEKAVAGGIDALLTTFGIASTFQKEIGNIGLILRIDGGTSQISANKNASMSNIYEIEDAIRLGADGVLCMGFPGAQNEDITLKDLAYNAARCREWGLVLGAEMLPRGFEPVEDSRDPANIALACRIGAELGADFIKTEYTGDKESFKKVVDGCYKPILILGGGRVKTEEDLLKTVKDSIEAGGRGVVMGRNIWKHPKPDKLCRAIAKIIHEDADIKEALKQL
jgi:class I fructose-bisphosphate aldolase